MLSGVELTTLYWTSSGVLPGDGEISPHEFADRVEAAARAGFKGVGLWHTDLEHLTVHRPLKELKRILDGNGVRLVELEFLTDWFLDGARKRESDNRKRRLLRAAEALQAHHIKIGDFYRSVCPMPRLAEAFAALCVEARDSGAAIGFEPMPSSVVNTLADSLRLVEEAGAANGGLILDISHVINIGIPFASVAAVPCRYLVCIELNDGTLPGSAGHNPSARRFCGEGEFDIKGYIDAVRRTGYEGPWALEVFNREYAGIPLRELSERSFQTTMSVF
jgi:sugar phosphate isomerase/epimerase